jgi:CRP/FNR family transcriptional regulator, cyclic AMP receptor protein
VNPPGAANPLDAFAQSQAGQPPVSSVSPALADRSAETLAAAQVTGELQQRLTDRGVELLNDRVDLVAHGAALRQAAPMLEHFHAHELETLGRYMAHIRAQPGVELLREGELGGWLLLILSGTVDITKKTSAGAVSRLAVVRIGAAIGEMSMMDGEPRNASAIAVEPVDAGLLTRASVGRLVQQHPDVGAKLLVHLVQMLATRLRNTNRQLIKRIEGEA